MNKKIPRINKQVISITALDNHTEEDNYWKSRTPAERLAGIEINRRLVYGAGVASRLQRFFEVAELSQG